MSKDAKFLIINSYSTGFSPSAISYLISEVIAKRRRGVVNSDEIGIKVSSSGLIIPAGITSMWVSDYN